MDQNHPIPYRNERTSNGSVFVSDTARTMNTLYRIVDYNGQDSVFVPGNKALVPDTTLSDIAAAWKTYKEGGDTKEIFGLLDALVANHKCDCAKCNPNLNRMIVCSECGNKRCPKATNHAHPCSRSNEPGQKGSSWEDYSVDALGADEPHTCTHREADGAECGHDVLSNNLCKFGHAQ